MIQDWGGFDIKIADSQRLIVPFSPLILVVRTAHRPSHLGQAVCLRDVQIRHRLLEDVHVDAASERLRLRSQMRSSSVYH